MSLVLIEPIQIIEQKVGRAIVQELNKRLPQIVGKVKDDFILALRNKYRDTPEYDSLTRGILQKDFGLSDQEAITKTDGILNLLADSVEVKFTRLAYRSNRITGGMTLYAFDASFKDLLNSQYAHVITDKNQQIEWLRWLLIEGDRIVVDEYSVNYVNSPRSRSGGALMVKDGRMFRVNPIYSGTVTDNWITRIASVYQSFFEAVINTSIQRHL